MTGRFSIVALLFAALLLGAAAACETGFASRPPGDDDAFDDDDLGNDDDSSADDDDTTPPGDDDDSSPSGNFEGDEPGECSDGADNDQDGLFDCDDPDCFGSPDCGGDDDTVPGDDDDTTPAGTGAPEITGVTYQWIPVDLTFEFSIDIIDLDCDLTPVILYWSYNGQAPSPLAPTGNTNPNCSSTYFFGLQIVNASPGQSYSVTFSVEDSAGNRSAEYTLIAEVPP